MMAEQVQKAELESYGEIGTLLRAAREQTRMPIDQCARLLHIRMRYLDALEQGRLHELPGLTYTRGYLQAYASFLGLDKDEVLRRFEDVEGALARKNIYFPQVFSKQKTPNYALIWGGLAFALFAYTFWAVVLQPPKAKISMVEVLPPFVQKKESVWDIANADVACLQEQDILYPPCTLKQKQGMDLLPLHSQAKSIADLAAVEQEEQ